MKNLYFTCLFAGLFAFPILSWAQPANDFCSEAIPVLLDEVVSFDNTDATTDGPLHPGCPSSQNDSIFSDIWYSYTAAFTGHVRWTLCSTAIFDTKIAAYAPGAACPPVDGDLLTCNDDHPDCDITSQVEFDVVSGSTYLLRLGGWGSTAPGEQGSGTFVVEQYTPPVGPPNNQCANAQVVTLGLDQPFNTLGATTDGPNHTGPCFQFNDPTVNNDVWYSYTAGFTGSVLWTVCNTASFDTRLAVYVPGAPCPPAGDADLHSCNDDGQDCLEYTSAVFFDVEQGETYLLRLGSYGGATGSGDFDLVEAVPPVPPANDLCGEPDSVFIMSEEDADLFEYAFEGTTENCQPVSTLPVCSSSSGGEFADVWYRFNTNGNETVEIRFYTLDPLATFYVELHTDCLTPVDTALYENECFIIDEFLPSATLDITGFPPTPTWYYIRVSTRLTSQSPGPFNFQLVGDILIDANNIPLNGQVTLLPNPVTEKLTVSYSPDQDREGDMLVTNALGEKIWKKAGISFQQGGQQEVIDVSTFQAGIYFLTITSGEQSVTKKFVKQ